MPTPTAVRLELSERQRLILEELSRQTTNSYRLVRRVNIILAAAESQTNTQISRQWQLERNQVRYWRQRWLESIAVLAACEQPDADPDDLRTHILEVLSDAPRPGKPPSYSPEQVVQIVAIACEVPSASGYPVSEWTPQLIANEAAHRGIVSDVSASSVRRFLKRSPITASSESLLAQCYPRRS